MKNDNVVWIAVLAVVLLFFLFVMPFGTGWGGLCGMMGGYSSGYGLGMMSGFGWPFMTLFLVALVLLIFWLVRQLQKDGKARRR